MHNSLDCARASAPSCAAPLGCGRQARAASLGPALNKGVVLAGVVDICLIPEVKFDVPALMAHARLLLQQKGHIVVRARSRAALTLDTAGNGLHCPPGLADGLRRDKRSMQPISAPSCCGHQARSEVHVFATRLAIWHLVCAGVCG